MGASKTRCPALGIKDRSRTQPANPVYSPATNFYQLQSPRNGKIVMFTDGRWRDFYVDQPTLPLTQATTYFPANTTGVGMGTIATVRHRRYTNVALMDLSVETIRLPQLWTDFRWRPDWQLIPKTAVPNPPW